MADSFVRVPNDSVGKKVDASSLDVGADTVYRQRIVIGDNAATAEFATVTGGILQVGGVFTLSGTATVAGTVNVNGGIAISGTAVVSGNVNISTMPAVVIAAGANNIGTVNDISRTVQVAVGTPFTVNNISATVVVSGVVRGQISSGASLSTINTPVLIGGNDSAGGGIARTLLLDTSGRVILGAGANNIGTINNISAAVVVSGAVSIAAGTSNIGTINDISRTVQVAVGTPFTIQAISTTVTVAGVVGLTAGTAVIGDINAISRTVQVAVGTPFTLQGISTTVIVAVSTPYIIQGISTTVTVAGNINISATAAVVVNGSVAHSASVTAGVLPMLIGMRAGTSASAAVAHRDASYAWGDKFGRQVVIGNHPSLLPSASHGPKCVTASTSAGVALVAAPGAGNSVYITQIACTNGSGTLTRADVFAASATASCIAQMYMAASGGGFVMKYDPPVQVLSNTGVTCRVDPDVSQAIFNIHFYVGPK